MLSIPMLNPMRGPAGLSYAHRPRASCTFLCVRTVRVRWQHAESYLSAVLVWVCPLLGVLFRYVCLRRMFRMHSEASLGTAEVVPKSPPL